MLEKTPQVDPIGLRRYFLLAWKWAWLIILLSAFAAVVTYTVSRIIPPVYQATTRLLINETPGTGVSDYTAILTGERQARTYAEMITNRPLLETVIMDLGLNLSVKDLAAAISVELITDTRLIAITVEDTNPFRAADIANAVANRFIYQLQTLDNSANTAARVNLEQQMKQLEGQIQATTTALDALGEGGDPAERDRLNTQLAEYRKTYANLVVEAENIRLAEASTNSGVVQLEPAIASTTPVRPRILINTILAALMGLVLGIGAIFLIESLDDTIRTPEDISRYLGLPIFGTIPLHETTPGKPVAILEPRSPASDAYRTLRANILFASVDRPLKSLLITSSMPGEGKSTISVNLSAVMAQNERQTTILDSDLRLPSIHKNLGIDNHRGLSDLLAGQQIGLDGSIQSAGIPNLSVLLTGDLPPNPTELLSSEKMSHILQLLSERADMLVIDTPPMITVADAAVLATRVDGVLLVIKPGVSRIHAVRQAIEQLRRAKANLLGVVLNAVDVKRNSYYGYSSYYYRYGKGKQKRGLLDRVLRKNP